MSILTASKFYTQGTWTKDWMFKPKKRKESKTEKKETDKPLYFHGYQKVEFKNQQQRLLVTRIATKLTAYSQKRISTLLVIQTYKKMSRKNL